MARLKCKCCEKTFELNGTTDINCPNCGEKLENSFTEWKKIKGNENKTFTDYKRKRCYPSSSSHSHQNQHLQIAQSSHSNNTYKHLYQSNKTKKRFQRRVYIYGAISTFIVLSLFTNPEIGDHKKAFHEKIFGKKQIQVVTTIIRREEIEEANANWKLESLVEEVESKLSVADFLLFSLTKITWLGRTYPIGFGMFGHVYIIDEVGRYKRHINR